MEVGTDALGAANLDSSIRLQARLTLPLPLQGRACSRLLHSGVCYPQADIRSSESCHREEQLLAAETHAGR